MFEPYCFLVLCCLFFGGHDFPIDISIPINYSLSSLFKGTSIGVYTLGFGLVLFCIRDGSNNYMPGNDFLPPVYVISGCITWPVIQLLASYFLFLVQLLLMKYHQNAIAKTCQASVSQFWVKSMHIVSFLGVYDKVNSMIWVFWLLSLWLWNVSDHWSVSRAAYYFLLALYHEIRNGLKERLENGLLVASCCS